MRNRCKKCGIIVHPDDMFKSKDGDHESRGKKLRHKSCRGVIELK